MTLTGLTIDGNRGSYAGGIEHSFGTLKLYNSVIKNNRSGTTRDGGGMRNGKDRVSKRKTYEGPVEDGWSSGIDAVGQSYERWREGWPNPVP